ncbi:hypothetical protein SAMN02745207_02314 [Clostridium grantii DSM 8605]|uniref:Uncharacterized protein n=2 Tax=Clostridium TaxID=1485 RepID=A0A1M5VKG1_9CLOT|nr:hypothetical protein SAMN02745207_02314 [Clostridium grantii DSM 8605]
MFFCVITTSAFAEGMKNEKVVFLKEEITDMKEIDNRLQLGITDDPSMEANLDFEDTIIIDNNGKKSKLVSDTVKITSQKIKEKVNKNGDIITDYIAYVVADIKEIPISKNESNINITNGPVAFISPSSFMSYLAFSGTQEEYDNDSSISTKTYIRIEYSGNSFSRNNVSYDLYKFTSVWGKVVIMDSQVTVTKLVISNTSYGDYYSDINAYNWVGRSSLSKTGTRISPASGSYYSITPINYYINTSCGGTGISYNKASATSYMTRGASSWTFKISITKIN